MTRSSSSPPACAAARACRSRSRRHPTVFVTLTAPSFGPVHSVRERNGRAQRCRPRRDAPVCEHGVRLSCGEVHDEDDPRLGEPICPDCFDYERAVIWNALAPELWRRTAIQIPRELARLSRHLAAPAARARARVVREGRRVPAPRHACTSTSSSGSTPRSRRIVRSWSSRRRRSSPASCSPRRSVPRPSTRVPLSPHRVRPPATSSSALGPPGRRARCSARSVGAEAARARRTSPSTRPRAPSRWAACTHRLSASDVERLAGAAARAADGAVCVGSRDGAALPARCGCGGGRTRSGSAGTASRRAAATRPRSRALRRARHEHVLARLHRGGRRDPWGRPWRDGQTVEHKRYAFTGTGYRTLGDAWLAETGRRRALERAPGRARGAAHRSARPVAR